MATVGISVTKFTVQYMLKDIERDMPKMLPVKSYSVDLELEVDDELEQFLPAYISGYQDSTSQDSTDRRIIPEYSAPSSVVKKWKKILLKEYPDNFDAKIMKPDMVIDCAISCTLEDSIKDALEEIWDNTLAKSLNAEPEVPEGYRVAGRYIHLADWTVK